jgi:menaquinone-specific isochorismate synthase
VSTPVADLRRGSTFRARTVPVEPDLDVIALAGESGFAWRSDRAELLTAGTAARIPLGPGTDRIVRAAASVEAVLGAIEVEADPGGPGPVAVGALPFASTAPGQLVVPELLLRRTPDGRLWATLVTGDGDGDDPDPLAALARFAAQPAGPAPLVTVRPVQERAWWEAAVETALGVIETGRVGKVVLAREVVVEADGPLRRSAVLTALAGRAVGCMLYAADGFVGASPELLVRREGGLATSCPLAGTAPRGSTPGEEAERLARLDSSVKDAAEHRFVVDAVAEALELVAEKVEVHPREIITLATVAHLATRIEAYLPEPGPSALELAGRLHPTPAVAGTPLDAALELLAELEPFQRGPYGGPVGWVDAAGDGEWAVALRGAELSGRTARLLAGAGIVPGSDPASEWAETEAKLGAMLPVLGA